MPVQMPANEEAGKMLSFTVGAVLVIGGAFVSGFLYGVHVGIIKATCLIRDTLLEKGGLTIYGVAYTVQKIEKENL